MNTQRNSFMGNATFRGRQSDAGAGASQSAAMFESLEQRRLMTVIYNGHAGMVDGDHLALIQPGRVTAPARPTMCDVMITS
jgi:hypothetical protein